ncbi:hypothetical protein [Candidatus Binatus sp.]|uniref:hypothetical protein n=1 Tax=Candidatus Binatus sp. TaxID=2811406 RepID=UPI002F955CD1
MSTQKKRKRMLIVPASTSLREAIETAQAHKEASFAVEHVGQVYVIEATQMFEQVAQRFGSDINPQLDRRHLQVLKSLRNSTLPVLAAFEQEGIRPFLASGPRESMKGVMAAGRFAVAEPSVRRFVLDPSDTARFRDNRSMLNAFSCVWECASKLHYWPCAAGDRPSLCPNGKPWAQQITI